MSLADCAEHQQLLSAAGAVPAAAALLARGAPAVQETLGLGLGLGSGLGSGLAHEGAGRLLERLALRLP